MYTRVLAGLSAIILSIGNGAMAQTSAGEAPSMRGPIGEGAPAATITPRRSKARKALGCIPAIHIKHASAMRTTSTKTVKRSTRVTTVQEQPLDASTAAKEAAAAAAPLTATVGANVELTVDKQEYLDEGRRGLHVYVHNGTKDALIFNGDCATVRAGGSAFQAAPAGPLFQSVCPPVSLGQEFVHALIDFGTAGMFDTGRDAERQEGPILGRYGCDQTRREVEQSRFGKRILWPGDSTDGIVYFNTDRTLNGGTIDLPVAVYYTAPTNTNPNGTQVPTNLDAGDQLVVPVTPSTQVNPSTSLGTPPAPPTTVAPVVTPSNVAPVRSINTANPAR